tara:strand:- start:172 stop:375 length:204 start_codon:yes stop_codon:yes gene_type:complete
MKKYSNEIESFLNNAFFFGDYSAHQTEKNIDCDGIRVFPNLTKEQTQRIYNLVLKGLDSEIKEAEDE